MQPTERRRRGEDRRNALSWCISPVGEAHLVHSQLERAAVNNLMTSSG